MDEEYEGVEELEPAGDESPEETEEEEGTEPSDEQEVTDDTPAEPPKKDGIQKRIDRLTRDKRALEREVEALRGQTARDAKPAAPEEKPRLDQFQTYEEWVMAAARWEARQELVENERQSKAKRVDENLAKAMDRARTTYEDFDEVLDDLPRVNFPNATTDAIKESDLSADILYHLGKNPAEAIRISKLPPIQQLKEIGKLEAKLEAKPDPTKKEVKKQPTAVEKSGGPAPKQQTGLKDLKARAMQTGLTEDWARYLEAGGT